MGTGSRIDHQLEEKYDFLRRLIDTGYLDGVALGITKKVITEGEEALSPKQKVVFQRYVLDEFVTAECRRCGDTPPWSEMYMAHHNGGYCDYCEHMMNKD